MLFYSVRWKSAYRWYDSRLSSKLFVTAKDLCGRYYAGRILRWSCSSLWSWMKWRHPGICERKVRPGEHPGTSLGRIQPIVSVMFRRSMQNGNLCTDHAKVERIFPQCGLLSSDAIQVQTSGSRSGRPRPAPVRPPDTPPTASRAVRSGIGCPSPSSVGITSLPRFNGWLGCVPLQIRFTTRLWPCQSSST